MREIKFRAWIQADPYDESDSPKMEMCYNLAFEDYEPLNDLLGAVEHLMQYTGLKDKNGVEIYEGDIVEYELGRYKDPDGDVHHPSNWETFKERAVIVYDSDKGRFKRKDRFHDFIDTPKSEVIGNIYEHSHLLKEED